MSKLLSIFTDAKTWALSAIGILLMGIAYLWARVRGERSRANDRDRESVIQIDEVRLRANEQRREILESEREALLRVRIADEEKRRIRADADTVIDRPPKTEAEAMAEIARLRKGLDDDEGPR